MLPTNPRAGRSRSVTRQPTVSQPRSTSVSRPRERYSVAEDRVTRGRTGYDGGNARQLHSQRSMGNVRPSRNKEPALPPPPPPTFPKTGMASRSMRSSPSTYSRPPPSRDSDSSSSSASSSGSSFLDRMRHRGAPSSSSQSSFELDLDASKETGGGNDTRKFGVIHHDDPTFAANDLVSYGYSIWNRVASAARDWAWSGSNTGSNSLISGVAPSSGDSEITRALKTYHISKARDRSDLPDWLFDEHERGVGSRTQYSARYEERGESIDDPGPITRSRGRGFRDIYDSVAVSSASEARSARGRVNLNDSGSSPSSVSSGLDRSTTRGADRLRAIRDAKRQQAARAERSGDHWQPAEPRPSPRGGSGSGSSGANSNRRNDQYDRRYEDSLSSRRGVQEVFREPVERNPAAGRVGLPTNPRRR